MCAFSIHIHICALLSLYTNKTHYMCSALCIHHHSHTSGIIPHQCSWFIFILSTDYDSITEYLTIYTQTLRFSVFLLPQTIIHILSMFLCTQRCRIARTNNGWILTMILKICSTKRDQLFNHHALTSSVWECVFYKLALWFFFFSQKMVFPNIVSEKWHPVILFYNFK
jgi:hypothetical protein